MRKKRSFFRLKEIRVGLVLVYVHVMGEKRMALCSIFILLLFRRFDFVVVDFLFIVTSII